MKIDFYTYRQVLELMYSTSGLLENLPMSIKEFKIYQGVASKIYVTIKNSDRKIVPAAGKLFTAYIVSNETEALVLQRQLDEVDAAAGHWELTLLEGDTSNWRPGYYKLAVTVQDENGDEYNLYNDFNYGASATIYLSENVTSPFKPAIISNASNWNETTGVWYSGAYPGDAQEGRHDGLHTISVYMTDFTGRFWVQASLENTAPSSNSAWFDVNLGGANDYLSYTNESDIQLINFNINAQWIRFRYDPDVSNTGTMDQVLFRT